MQLIVNNMKWILIVIGVITCTMVMSVIAPNNGLINTFGASYASLDHPIAQTVTRSWGVLITLTGGMLVYAAFNLHVRKFAMIVASISKGCFVALVLIYAGEYMDKAIVPVLFDSLAVLIFIVYLFKTKSN